MPRRFPLLLDRVLELFGDGKWHSSKELAEKLNVDLMLMHDIVSFFARWGFVKFDEHSHLAIIEPAVLRMLRSAE